MFSEEKHDLREIVFFRRQVSSVIPTSTPCVYSEFGGYIAFDNIPAIRAAVGKFVPNGASLEHQRVLRVLKDSNLSMLPPL